jgi:hypothetical protein
LYNGLIMDWYNPKHGAKPKLRFDLWPTFFLERYNSYWLHWRQFTSLLIILQFHEPPPYFYDSDILLLTQPYVLTPRRQNPATGYDPKPIPSECHSYKLFLHRLFRLYNVYVTKRACAVSCPRNCKFESDVFLASSCLSTSWMEVQYSCKYRYPRPELATPWRKERVTWHAALDFLPVFYIIFARPASLYCEK